MITSKQPWPLATVCGISDRINTNPDFQRPAVWTNSQKQLLVDTVLRGYDIPKFYWRRTGSNPDRYEVVDGQQRLRAIWGYKKGDFGLPKDADSVEGIPVDGLKYDEIPDELRMRFDIYPLDVIVIEDADDDEVREMFLRLQNGTSLRAQEKRNAYPGNMRNFVRSLAEHPFFSSVGFSDSRYTHDLVAAQLVQLELAGGPANVKNADLNKMYTIGIDFDFSSAEAKSVAKRLSVLHDAFPTKTPELTRFNSITLYAVVAELMTAYVSEDFEPRIHDWFIEFEAQRAEQEKLSEDEAVPEWVQYKEKISHSTDSEDSIRWRMDFMLKDLLLKHPDIRLKDPRRGFTPQQRLAVFRRDQGICQVKIQCEGVRLRWDDWHCDHKTPHSLGGTTSVANAQVACPACNLAKSNAA